MGCRKLLKLWYCTKHHIKFSNQAINRYGEETESLSQTPKGGKMCRFNRFFIITVCVVAISSFSAKFCFSQESNWQICSDKEDTLSTEEVTFLDGLNTNRKALKTISELSDWIQQDKSRVERGHKNIQNILFFIIEKGGIEYKVGDEALYEKASNFLKVLPAYSPEAAVYREVTFLVADSLFGYGMDKATSGMSNQEKVQIMLSNDFHKKLQEINAVRFKLKNSIIALTVDDLKSKVWKDCERQQLWLFLGRLVGGGVYYKEQGKGIEGSNELVKVMTKIASKESSSVKPVADKVMESIKKTKKSKTGNKKR